MYSLSAILAILRKHKPGLQGKYPISGLGVFGSYARGEATEDSDIDIAVDIIGPMGLSFVAMAEEIESLLGWKVDLVPKRSIKPEYLPFIGGTLSMHKRKPSLFIKDILRCIEHTQTYTTNLSFEEFSKNFLVVGACLYNIQVIGESVSQLPDSIKFSRQEIPWI